MRVDVESITPHRSIREDKTTFRRWKPFLPGSARLFCSPVALISDVGPEEKSRHTGNLTQDREETSQ